MCAAALRIERKERSHTAAVGGARLGESHDVLPFMDDHPLVAAQLPIDQIVSHVHGMDQLGPVLQKTVGEPAG